MSKKSIELFDFSESVIKNIKEKFIELKRKGDLINNENHLTRKDKEILLEKLLFNLINQALENREKENNYKYTDEEKDRFRKKIISILRE